MNIKMCNSKIEKDEVFINQNAAGGAKNEATMTEMKYHLSTISIIMIIICALLAIGGIYTPLYRLYKKCHENWSRNMIVHYNLRRSFNRGRRELQCEYHDGANKRDVCVDMQK